MLKRRILGIAGLLAVAGCGLPILPSATLPPDAVQGAGDPLRAAVSQSSYVFGNARLFGGRPEDVARAVANQEFLAVAVQSDPRVSVYGATVPVLLQDGRNEARGFYGIAPEAPAQLVIDSLYSFARALRAGDRVAAERALVASAFPNPATTMARLNQAPALPISNVATARAFEEMTQTRVERML